MVANDTPSFTSQSALRRFFHFASWPLRFKVTLGAALIAFLTAASVTLATRAITSRELTAAIGDNLQSRAVAEGERIGDALTEQINVVRTLTLNPIIVDTLQEKNSAYSGDAETILQQLQQDNAVWQTLDNDAPQVLALARGNIPTELNKFQSKFGITTRAQVTNRYGAVVGAIGGRPDDYYVGDQDWWQITWNQGIGGLYVSQPFIDPVSNQRVIGIATSIIDPSSGRFDGVIYVLNNFSTLEKLVGDVRLGTTGYSTLVQQDSTIISGLDQPLDAFLRQPVAAQSATWVSGRFRDQDSVIGLAPVSSRAGLPVINGLGWVMLIHQDQAEALNAVASTTTWSLVILAISMIIIVILSFYAAGLLTQSVQQVAEAAERIRAGDLKVTVPVRSQDEIGVLARAFNAMTKQLQDLIQALETRVQERTLEASRRSTQLQTLLKVGSAISSLTSPDEVLKQAIDMICAQFGYYYASVLLLDTTGQLLELRAAHGEVGRQLMIENFKLKVGSQSMVGWVAANQQTRVAQKTSEDSMLFDHPLLPATRSEISLPLIAHNRLLGVLDVQSTQENAFDEQSIATLQGLASQLAVALENARLFQETQKTLGKAEVLYEASRRLTTATTTRQVAEAITASVAETGADGCTVIEFDLDPDNAPRLLIYQDAWRRDRSPLFQPGLRLPISQSPFPLDMIGTLWTVPNVAQDKSLPPRVREVFEATDVKALVNIPLRTKGKVIGQVVVLRTSPGPFPETARRLYEMLSDQAAVALERARLLEEAQRRAEREKLISEITARVRAGFTLEQVLQTTAQEVGQTLGAARVAVQLHPAQNEAELKPPDDSADH